LDSSLAVHIVGIELDLFVLMILLWAHSTCLVKLTGLLTNHSCNLDHYMLLVPLPYFNGSVEKALGMSFIILIGCVHLNGQNHVSDDHHRIGLISNLDNAVLLHGKEQYCC